MGGMGEDADGADGRCRYGDADGVDGGMQMGTDADGADAESPCPPLRRGAGEGWAAAWLSTLSPFGKPSQAPVLLLCFFLS